MAMKLFNDISAYTDKNVFAWTNTQVRAGAFPLDKWSVFPDKQSALDYVNELTDIAGMGDATGLPYEGQLIAVLEGGKQVAYVLDHTATGGLRRVGNDPISVSADISAIAETYAVSALTDAKEYTDEVSAANEIAWKKYTDDSIDALEGSATIATNTEGVVTIKGGVAEDGGIISNSSADDITLAKVATTGAAEDVSITATGITATDVKAAIVEVKTGAANALTDAIEALDFAQLNVGEDKTLSFVRQDDGKLSAEVVSIKIAAAEDATTQVTGLSAGAFRGVTGADVDFPSDATLPTTAAVSAFVDEKVKDLEGALHFKGTIVREEGESDAQAIARVVTTPKSGDVVVMSDNTKEYIYNGTKWEELGDQNIYVTKATTIAGVDLVDNITKSELQTALDIPTISADTLDAAKAYTDAEIQKLDATVSTDVAAGKIITDVTITEVDGKLTGVSVTEGTLSASQVAYTRDMGPDTEPIVFDSVAAALDDLELRMDEHWEITDALDERLSAAEEDIVALDERLSAAEEDIAALESDLSDNYVPYEGATKAINLNSKSMSGVNELRANGVVANDMYAINTLSVGNIELSENNSRLTTGTETFAFTSEVQAVEDKLDGRKVIAGAGLTGGGELSADVTITHAAGQTITENTTANKFANNITVDQFGHLTGVTYTNETTLSKTDATGDLVTGLSVSDHNITLEKTFLKTIDTSNIALEVPEEPESLTGSEAGTIQLAKIAKTSNAADLVQYVNDYLILDCGDAFSVMENNPASRAERLAAEIVGQ